MSRKFVSLLAALVAAFFCLDATAQAVTAVDSSTSQPKPVYSTGNAMWVTLQGSSGTAAEFQIVTPDGDSAMDETANAVKVTLATALSSSTDSVTAVDGTSTSVCHILDSDESEDECDDNSGVLVNLDMCNEDAEVNYVRIYNADADDVTVGTTAANAVYVVPAGTCYTVTGINYSYTNLSIATTGGRAANDATDPGANKMMINAWYR